MAAASGHYAALFGDAPALAELRENYALHASAVPDPQRRENLSALFFWTAWAATTERPGQASTYTNNWPHEPLVGNRPTAANLLWSIVSVALLIAGIGALVYFRTFRGEAEEALQPPAADPFEAVAATASMKATAKYAVTVILLFGLQALLGALTAHYTVEGDAFFGIPLSQILPYAVTRTWHIQLAVFWIATAFLAAGLYLAPVGHWREAPLRIAFWGMNAGLALMIVLSLLPIGLIQAYASMEHGLWYARSAEFMQQPLIVFLRWLRMVGDTVFLVGVGALTWFLVGLKTGWSYARPAAEQGPGAGLGTRPAPAAMLKS